MILEHLAALNQKQIVLASASPRRSELLRQIGLKSLEIIPSRYWQSFSSCGRNYPYIETLPLAERYLLCGNLPCLANSAIKTKA